MTMAFARSRRDDGIKRASRDRDWQIAAYCLLQQWVAMHRVCKRSFLTEAFRAWAEGKGLSPPHDGRAYGGVVQKAVKDGLVMKAGYAPAKSSNLSPKVLWLPL